MDKNLLRRDPSGDPAQTVKKRPPHQLWGLILGPSFLVGMATMSPVAGLSEPAWLTGAITLWIACWWATEAVPIPVTALLPLLLFPLFGIVELPAISRSYASPAIYLLIGGFILALALQRWSLHQRIALLILSQSSGSPGAIVWGFMLVTALLSMWVSNTATTLMVLPIAMSVALVIAPDQSQRSHQNFLISLLLAVAYSANIGGMGTLVGTPPNLLMAGFLRQQFNITLDFFDWMLLAVPLIAIILPVCWWTLTRIAFPSTALKQNNDEVKSSISEKYRSLGLTSIPEWRVAIIFVIVVSLWISRKWVILATGIQGISDTGIAIAGAIALFIVPSGKGGPLLDWTHAKKLPWDVVLLYGGGMALAAAITDSGLAASFGGVLEHISDIHLLLLIVVVAGIVLFLTELTNNSATIATFMPLLGILSVATDQSPLQFIAPATLAASCAFMLPVATPPNAIIYGSGMVSLPQMARAGLLINIASLLLIPTLTYLLIPIIF